MFVNLVLFVVGLWGIYYTWTRRHQSGRSRYFDLVARERHPLLYLITIWIRLLIWGLCVIVGCYRLLTGTTD